ncbi:MAG: penicillin-binding transpeptidase domain-containing protein [Acidobacteriota bacterium]
METRNSGKVITARYWSCCVLLNIAVFACFGFILCKAFYLQVIDHSAWAQRCKDQSMGVLKVPAYRGTIYDRNGQLLSYSVPQKSLFAAPNEVKDPKALAFQLAPVLDEPPSILEKKFSCGRRFIWVKRLLTDQQARAVEKLKEKGLHLVDEYKRFYPNRQVAGQVVGFVDSDGVGIEGAEKSFDEVLRAAPKAVGQLRDGVKTGIWLESDPPPEPAESYGVRLSIDAHLQYIAECELEKIALQYQAKSAEVVMLDARTGETLAMVNWPFFDPNHNDKKTPDAWRNRAITDAFEPGSTFKVFLMSAALEEGVVKDRDKIFCENGKFQFAGHTIKDVHPYGTLSMADVIKHSSNIASAKLALQLGNDRFHRYIKGFGFGQKTGIRLPGEENGLVRYYKKWRPIELATTGFGQGIGITALQLSAAVGCIARGGEYIQPLLAREVVDTEGRTVNSFQPDQVRRVVQKRTAQTVAAMMQGVTEEGGTGVNAAPDGYTVAGKTGTAQVLDPVTKRYSCNKYTSGFTGFTPVEDPRLVITVVVHEPHGAIYGGVVAAPVFRNLAAKALPYLGVAPTINATPPPAGVRTVSVPGSGTQPAKIVKAGAAAPTVKAVGAEGRPAVTCDPRAVQPSQQPAAKTQTPVAVKAATPVKEAIKPVRPNVEPKNGQKVASGIYSLKNDNRTALTLD